jgi:hypothetical protein
MTGGTGVGPLGVGTGVGGSGEEVGEGAGRGVVVGVPVANAAVELGRTAVEVGSAGAGLQPPAARNTTHVNKAALTSVEVVPMGESSPLTLIAI